MGCTYDSSADCFAYSDYSDLHFGNGQLSRWGSGPQML
jgi:hypothetical protein